MQFDQSIISALEDTTRHHFLTGDAGTGKTTIIKHIMERNAGKCIVLAPTGVAAVNAGGETIHRFCSFPARPIGYENVVKLDLSRDPDGYRNNVSHYEKYEIVRAAKYLIIDEISMVRADLMDQLAWWFHKNFHDIRRADGTKLGPFGGLKVIMVGDLSQLPPVVASDAERDMIKARYKSEFFFDARCWTNPDYAKFETIKLTKIYRQSDEKFINFLNGIKNNTINTFALKDFSDQRYSTNDLRPDSGIVLAATNSIADTINKSMLSRIDKPEVVLSGVIKGNFNTADAGVDKDIILKPGCRVMFLRNHQYGMYQNGTCGKFIDVKKENNQITAIIIQLDDGTEIDLLPYRFESVKFKFNKESDSIETETGGEFIQYPIRLAYAITIHKSQGKTFDKVVIDMGRGGFAHGQLYVALSRCRTMEGITLRTPISNKDLVFNKRVMEFNKGL